MSTSTLFRWLLVLYLLAFVIGCGEGPQPGGGSETPAAGVVGRVEASFDVDSAGGATYTIPIKVPPGTLDIQPRISVSYNSHAANGLLGVGFELEGLSKIERCEQTVAQDGRIRSVQWDEEDRFCMDGLRLIAVDGDHGADGTVYMTEAQTWSRVASAGICKDTIAPDEVGGGVTVGGPCSFDVTLKNGTRVEFGDAELAECANSGAENNARLYWPMTRLIDLHGNSLAIDYREGGSNTCVPDAIQYTSNESQGAPALRRVDFEYVPRDDTVASFVGGLEFERNVLLDRIDTIVRDDQNPTLETLVKTYHFEYGSGGTIDYSADSERALLRAVRECDGNGVCLPDTEFDWTAGDWMSYTRNVTPTGANQAPSPSWGAVASGDFDGNGLIDYIQIPYALNRETGSQYLAIEPGGNDFRGLPWIHYSRVEQMINSPRFQTGDFDGDGFTDVILFGHINWDEDGFDGWRLMRGGPDGLADVGSQPTINADAQGSEPTLDDRIFVGDFTGDGRTDLFALVGATAGGSLGACDDQEFFGWRLYPSTGTGFDPPESGDFDQGDFPLLWHECAGPDQRITFHLADFNGDGRVDFLTTKLLENVANTPSNPSYHRGWRLFLSDGTTFQEQASGVWPPGRVRVTTGDFNGDGLTDVVLTGDRIWDEPATSWIVDQPGYVLVVSTGRTLEPVLPNPTPHPIDLMGGTGPQSVDWGSTGSSPDAHDALEVGNFNDDGMDDLLITSVLPLSLTSYDGAHLFVSRGDHFDDVATQPKDRNLNHLGGDFTGAGRTSYFVRSGQLFYQMYTTPKPDLLSTIVDGVGAEIEVDYDPMTAYGGYQKGTQAVYPARDFVGPRYLVRNIVRRNGSGEIHKTSYHFEGARTDLTGRGFLGFDRVAVRHSNPARAVITEYRTDFPFAGSVESQEIRATTAEIPIKRTTFEYENHIHPSYPGIYNIVLLNERTTDYASATQPGLTSGQDYAYDDFGNVVILRDRGDVANDDFDLLTLTTYSNDTNLWRIGFPAEVTVFQDPSEPLRKKKVVYDAQMNVEFEGDWDETHTQWLGNTYEYDVFGNRRNTTDPLDAVTTVSFDAYGFPQTTENHLGHRLETVYDPAHGLEVERLDANGHPTFTFHDGFGRPTEIRAQGPLGQIVTVRRFGLTAPASGLGWVTQSWVRRSWDVSANPEWDWTEELRDAWGRVYRQRRRGVGTTAIVTDREYLGLDLVRRFSRPYFEGSQPQWIEYTYDPKNRVERVELPSNQVSESRYDDLARTITRVDPNLEETVLHLNPRGKLVRKVDPLGAQTVYGYDPLGRRTVLAIGGSLSTTVQYDSLGRKTRITDTSSGETVFVYDGDGQLVREIDAENQSVIRDYDDLGRTKEKTYLPAPGASPSKRVLLDYDDPALANSIGQLTGVTSVEGTTEVSSYEYAYDPQGHLSRARLDLEGTTYTWREIFDPAGNVVGRTYPDGSHVQLEFSTAGFLDQIRLHDGQDPPGVYETWADYHDHDAEGRPAWVVYRNNVATCWEYDLPSARLQRTITSHFSVSPQNPCGEPAGGLPGENRYLEHSHSWDEVNNVLELEDDLEPLRTQTFEYNARGDLMRAEGIYGVHTYDYSPGGTRDERDGVAYARSFQQITGSTAGLAITYDDNGNVLTKTDGSSSWTYEWDADDLLRRVTRDGRETTFDYDYAGRRLVKRDHDGTVTYYISPLYEITIDPGGAATHTKYLEGPAGRMAQISKTGVQVAMIPPSQHYLALAGMYDPGSLSGAVSRLRYLALALIHQPDLARNAAVGLLVLAALLCAALTVRLGRQLRHGAGTESARRSPRFAMLTPVVILVVLATYGAGDAYATMSPGPNGPGRPSVGVNFFHTNHIGSSILVTDGAGATSARVEYEPYGSVYQPQSGGTDDFRPKFGGKEWDDEAGLYYFGARYYDPTIGRFISPDRSAGASELKTVSLDRYAYAQNNPVTYSDPSGRFVWAFPALLIGGFTIGFLVAGTQGKILSDPAHAFDNWSWSRALLGAWVGMILNAVSFGLTTIGTTSVTSAITLFGAKIGTLASSTFNAGVLSATFEYARGETDAAAIVGYFGVGLITGFASGTNLLGIAAGGVGKLAGETATSFANSLLKKVVNPDKPLEINLWAFRVSIDKNGNRKYDVNEMFLLSQLSTFFINVGALDSNPLERVKEGWSWDRLSQEIVEPKRLGSLEEFAALMPKSYADPGAPSMGSALSSLLKNTFHAATGPCNGDACGFYNSVVKKGIDKGFDQMGTADGPLSQWTTPASAR